MVRQLFFLGGRGSELSESLEALGGGDKGEGEGIEEGKGEGGAGVEFVLSEVFEVSVRVCWGSVCVPSVSGVLCEKGRNESLGGGLLTFTVRLGGGVVEL